MIKTKKRSGLQQQQHRKRHVHLLALPLTLCIPMFATWPVRVHSCFLFFFCFDFPIRPPHVARRPASTHTHTRIFVGFESLCCGFCFRSFLLTVCFCSGFGCSMGLLSFSSSPAQRRCICVCTRALRFSFLSGGGRGGASLLISALVLRWQPRPRSLTFLSLHFILVFV